MLDVSAGAWSAGVREHAVPGAPPAEWTDGRLVDGCLAGDQQAWAMLIGRYKNLIYSFPRRYGAGTADAADVFQTVCAELFRTLPRLRNHESVRAWITIVASHQAYQWKRRFVARVRREGEDPDIAAETAATEPRDHVLQGERERLVRDALTQLSPRCRRMLELLFYDDPPLPYDAVADQLGLAAGSVGGIRARCLKKMERLLIEVEPCQ